MSEAYDAPNRKWRAGGDRGSYGFNKTICPCDGKLCDCALAEKCNPLKGCKGCDCPSKSR